MRNTGKFIDYLETEDFDYQTQTEERFRQLIAAAKQEKYYDPLTDAFNDLEKNWPMIRKETSKHSNRK
jgi:hypothetical protein